MGAARRVREPYAWLGVGALTLGIGAALAGAGVASADSTPSEGSASSASSSARSAGSASRGDAARPARERSAAVRTATAAANASSTAPASFAVPAGAAAPAAAATITSRSTRTVSSKIRPAAVPEAAALSNSFTPPAAPWKPGSLVQAAFQHGVVLHALQGQVLGYQPTAQASQFAASGVDVAPTVAGMINAYAEGQPLEYTVKAEPLNGTVTIADDGSFIYTPDPDFAAEGGNDVFSVKVTNTARTLLNLLGAPGLSTDVMVPVTMAAVDNAALTAFTSSSTAGYTIWNQTYRPVVIDGYLKYDGVISGPAIGTVLAPAGEPGSGAYWLLNEQGEHQQVAVHLTNVGDSTQAWWVEFQTKPSNGTGHDTTTCSGNSGGVQCSTDGYQTAWLMDPAGTKVYVDSSDAQQQSDYLGSLCDSSFSNCSYTYKLSSASVAYTNPIAPIGFVGYTNLPGPGAQPVTDVEKFNTTVATTQTSAVTDTYQVTVSMTAGQKDVMSATVAEAYSVATGYSLATTSSYFVEVDATIPSGESYYLYYELPNNLQWGDWQLSYGATTYYLQDVWYLNPLQSVNPQYFGYHCVVGEESCDAATLGYATNPITAPPQVTVHLPAPAYVLQ